MDFSLIGAGAIFVNSYGYEQTNVHYWQVVERRGSRVYLAEIEKEAVPGGKPGSYSRHVRPVAGAFIERCRVCNGGALALCHERGESEVHAFDPYVPLVAKRIQFHDGQPGVSFECGSGELVAGIAGEYVTHYESSYA